MKQTRITHPTPLLGTDGALHQPGYATRMLYRYNRHRLQCHPFALKEWDFYQMMLDSHILQMTFGHVSYMASFSATLFSLDGAVRHSFTRMKPLPLRSLHMPLTPDAPHALHAHGNGWRMDFNIQANTRRLRLLADDVDIDIALENRPQDEKMVIATPFHTPGQFYLNCKENYYSVAGRARFGAYEARPTATDTALLDWGRGVWPFHQEWFWGNGAALLPNGRFGFNIGWGFGNLTHATENMFFWNGRAHKLGRLAVTRDETDYLKPWHFVDEDGRFDFVMSPFYDNDTATRLLFVNNRCHQVFGRFNGVAVLPNGQEIQVQNMPAFCEHAVNNW